MQHPTSHIQSKIAERTCVLLLLAFTLVMLLLQFTRPATALADQTELAVNVIPSSVDIPHQGSVQVQIMVNNLSTSMLQNVVLSSFTNAAVKVMPVSFSHLNTLAPGGEYVWNATLMQAGGGLLPGTVQFRVDYLRPLQSPAQGQPGFVQRVVFATLAVQSLKPQVAQQVADVQVDTSLSSLNEQQPGQVYLLITNKSDFSLVVNKLTPKGPDFVKLVPENFKDGVPVNQLTVPPRQAITITIDVMAVGPVQPGNQLLVFEIALGWDDGEQQQVGNLVATQQVNVGVLGESEILSLLGIPSFLFLPGFLALITIRLFWEINKKQEGDTFPLKTLSPEFGLIAVTLSGIAAALYPFITQWLTGVRRNYLIRYDLSDVENIWLGSIIVALAVMSGIRVVTWLYQRLMRPSVKDSAITTIRKLSRRRLNLVRPYVIVKLDGEEKYGYLLERHKENKQEYWVSPAIVIQWKASNNPSLRKKLDDYLAINSDNQVAPFAAWHLANVLQKDNHVAIEVSYETLGEPHGPMKIKREFIVDLFASPQLIVQQKY